MGKLLKWIVRSDQPFSIVDFNKMLEYAKTDITVQSYILIQGISIQGTNVLAFWNAHQLNYPFSVRWQETIWQFRR